MRARSAVSFFALAFLTGCSAETAGIRFDLRGANTRYLWELKEDGSLTVTDASALDIDKYEVLFNVALDEPARRHIAQVVARGGFLLDARGQVGEGSMMQEMLVEASCGWMDNRMVIRSAWVDSVGQMAAALNEHLPARVQVPYTKDRFPTLTERNFDVPADDDWRRDIERDIQEHW